MKNASKTPGPPNLIYKGRVFEVYEGDVMFPDGRIGFFSWLTHQPVIVVLPITNEGKIVLLHQYRPAIGATLLAIFETAIAKMRVFRVPEFLGAALMLGFLGVLLLFVSRGL